MKTDTKLENHITQDVNHKILVVDDNPTSLLKMSIAAKKLGHDTSLAEDGLVALDVLREENFDLVLLDIEMPNLDGYGVLIAMREDPSLRDIPVIVISAADEMDNVVRAIELGAQDFLTKNFERILFAARVGACLENKRLLDQRANHMVQIETARQRADDLLHATLPAAAIVELKNTNKVLPRRYEDVVVLMADVAGFTRFCDTNPPEEAVSRLESLVTGFEEITRKHGLEKIKTIGDAYMATAGLLEPNEDTIGAAIHSALEMVAAAPELASGWQVRVGLHCGPVVAGVIGKQQHLFDLWGDTVNTAARLTGLAEQNSVCVSSVVWKNAKCEGETMGTFDVKGKGTLEVFKITSALPQVR